MYLEDYLIEVEIDGQRISISKLDDFMKSYPEDKDSVFVNVYLGGVYWAHGHITKYSNIVIYSQKLKIPPGGINWNKDHRPFQLFDCELF